MANRARRISRSLPKPSLPPPDTLSFQRDAKLCQSNLDIVSTITRGERKRERDRTSKKGALFISRNEFRGAKKSMDVQWREYPSYLFPFPLSLSARSSILPFYLARSSPMRLPPPMSAGSMDGRYLFFVTRNCDPVFLEGSANYAHHRPPPTVSKTVVLKKKKRKKEERKKGERVFILRTHGDYVRSTGEGGC